jgi:signal transduction histidine kinase
VQRRLEALADTNRGLNREISRRQTVEQALQKSEHHQNRLLRQSRHMQEQLRHLSHQILRAQEEERKRISRELHDEIAQTLVGITVHLAALTREAAGNPRGLEQKIARTQRLVEKSVDIVHRFARELRPTVLDDLGLIPALHAFMKEFTKQTGIRIHFTTFTSSRIKQLSNATRTVLYRVLQEALTNVARHAQAGFVDVNIEKLPNAICLKIKDNGKSFNVERVLHSKGNGRLGLLGMRERLEMVGGRFDIESVPGTGTTIQAQIPLGKARGAGRKTR